MPFTTTDQPLVTVFIGTHDRAEYLDDALYSVLIQDFNDYEVLIRDNCSTDETKSVVDKYEKLFNLGSRFRYSRTSTDIGIRANLRAGIAHDSRGKYCINLHDDDFFINEKVLSSYVDILENDPTVAYVSSFPLRYDMEDEPMTAKEIIGYNQKTDISADRMKFDGKQFFLNFLTSYPTLNFSSTLFRRELAIERGWEQYGSLDQSLALLLSLGNNIVYIKDSLTCYRFHNSPDRGWVPLRTSGIPVDLAVESHKAIAKWIDSARPYLGVSRLSLFIWRLKAMILKEGYGMGSMFKSDPAKIPLFLNEIKKTSYINYLVLKWLVPEMIRIQATERPDNLFRRAFHPFFISLRTRMSQIIVSVSRLMFDPDYTLTPRQFVRWLFTGSR